MNKITRYAVALVLPDEIEELLDRLRGKFSENMTHISIPHITLAYPFTTGIDITLINDKLREAAGRTKAFRLVLDGVEYFESDSNVAYVAIANKQPVVDLHRDINRSLNNLVVDGYKGEFNMENFIPHVTIGTAIPDDILPEVKETVLKRTYIASVR